jgi:DNA replication protein DnaC
VRKLISDAVEAIAKKAAEANAAVEGDYIKDGLLHCGKCNTPKQCRVPNPFKAGQVDIRHCICKCRVEELKAEEERRKQAKRAERIKDMRRIGFQDAEMQNWTFEKDDGANKKIMDVMRNYVQNFTRMKEDGKGLLLYGTVGTGKTFASACVANALIDMGYPCLMTNFKKIANTLMGMYDGKQNYIDGLNRFDLLIIDDLASERNTEYMNEVVQEIVDSRYRAGLPLIITTNLTADEIKHPAEISKQRTYSRLLEMCLPLEVKGQDRRKKKLTEQYSGYADLLGM